MLIRHSPDAYEKLRLLGGEATDDVLSDDTERRSNVPRHAHTQPRNRNVPASVYRAVMPSGKSISLMRLMFTDFCKYDCAYCPNSTWVPRKRYAFKVEELAGLFMQLYQRQTVEGLFLSSGIAGSPDKTMSKLLDVVEMLRHHYRFRGYIHLKVMPGTSAQCVEAAYRLGTRLSINIETPTQEHMERLSTMKDFNQDILDPMGAIHRFTQEDGTGASGQVTQMVVGAADESDWDIYQRMNQLYTQWGFKRVYYSPFRPARYTPLEENPATPMLRAHRLYQMDWLSRIYGYTEEELQPAFDSAGLLSLDLDPKLLVALEQGQDGPVDINRADYRQLLRVPGIGPVAAKRIVANRRQHTVDTWRDLQAMGVVAKRARAFVGFPGYRPERSRQLRLDMFQGPEATNQPAAEVGGGCSSCTTQACGGCPVASLRSAPALAGAPAG